MRISIDQSLCRRYGMCVKLAPEIFRVQDDNHKTMVYRTPIPGSYIELCRKAARNCPNGAISIDEEHPIYPKPTMPQSTAGALV